MLITKFKSLSDIKYVPLYPDIISFFNNIKHYDDIPNIIFYGPHNTLKKLLVNQCLEILTDKNIYDLVSVPYVIDTSTNKQNIKYIQQSDYHIIINPTGNNSDRYIVQNIIKQYAQILTLPNISLKYKIVLINNAHNLSYIAQASLRRTMEQYNYNCRFIMICDNLLSKSLESRCYHIRVPLPSDETYAHFLYMLAIQNHIKIPISHLIPLVLKFEKNFNKLVWFVTYLKFNYASIDILNNINFDNNDFDNIIITIYKSILTKDISCIKQFMDIYYNCTITDIEPYKLIKHLGLSFLKFNYFNKNITRKIINLTVEMCDLLSKSRRYHSIFKSFIITILTII